MGKSALEVSENIFGKFAARYGVDFDRETMVEFVATQSEWIRDDPSYEGMESSERLQDMKAFAYEYAERWLDTDNGPWNLLMTTAYGGHEGTDPLDSPALWFVYRDMAAKMYEWVSEEINDSM